MNILAKLKWLILSLLLMFFSAGIFIGSAGKAEAHPNNPWNWAPPPAGNCVTSAPWTGYYMYANTSSSVISLPYGTTSTSFSMFAENKVCPGAPYAEAYNVYFNIWNINGNISGLGNYNMGTVGKGPGGIFSSWPNQSQSKWITVNTNSIKNSPGNHNFCFNWQGHGDYGPGKNDHHTTSVQTFCIDIYIQPQPQGTLTIIKYPQGGANNTHLDGCRMFIFAKLECTGNGGSKSVTLNAGSNYTVAGFPDSGYKVTKIRVNGPGCSPCEYNTSYLSNIRVDAGATTFVDIFYEPEKGTLQVVKYPERGATDANLTAVAKNGSGTTEYTVGWTEHTQSKLVKVADNNFKVENSPASGFKVRKVRVNRSNASGGFTTICDPCALSGNNINNVQVVDGRTTWVDVFYEPDIDSNLSWVCPKPQSDSTPVTYNGKIRGWVKDTINSGGASKIDVYIDSNNPGNTSANGYIGRYDANASRTGPPGPSGNYGYELDVPSQYFDGNAHTIHIFVLRKNGYGFWVNIGSGYQVNNSPKQFNCGGPQGAARCLTESSINYIQGWGLDPRRPGQNPSFRFYFDGSATPEPVAGSELRPDKVTDFRNQGYPGILDTVKYGFKYQIPDKFHDGVNHTLKIYLSTLSPPDKELSYVPAGTQITFGPNIDCSGGPVDPWYWPWMQTQNGDVIASGKITGQRTDLPGSRLQNSAEKEAEYLVISVIGGDGPFCSTYNYILTNTSATGGNCGNGNGYNVLDKYQLGTNPNDNVYNAIVKAYNENGGGNTSGNANTQCSPYNTFSNIFNPIGTGVGTSGQPICLNGSIFRASGSLANISVKSGRNTIFSDSELFILGDITYDYAGGYPQPDAEKKVPNLAIIVNGDVKIGTGVRRIDAAIYATGKVYTCNSNGNAGQTSPPEQCREQLVVNGMLVGKNGFLFGRSFFDTPRNPAESIRLTGQTVAFPPPGLDSSYFAEFDNSVKIDSGEFQPRF